MQTTTRGGFRYPDGNDAPDVPLWMNRLATDLAGGVALDSQGTLNARPSAGVAGRYYKSTDTGQIDRDDGTQWDTVRPPEPVTVLPASPAIGQRATVTTPNGGLWDFVFYKAFDDTAPHWLFLGGAPASGTSSMVQQTLGVDFATDVNNAASINVPVSGMYVVRWGGKMRTNTAGANAEMKVGQTGVSSGLAALAPSPSANVETTVYMQQVLANLTGGSPIRTWLRSNMSNATAYAVTPWIEITPVRLNAT